VQRSVVDPDRALIAIDGEAIVASAVSAAFQLTVPGGDFVPCSGITSVVTLPTHRRRGIGRALMERQLGDVHERGDPVAYLWASEAAIYQRYGYGAGAMTGTFKIRRENTGFLRQIDTPGRIRLVQKDEALKVVGDVYERIRPTRPGMTDRSGPWPEYRFHHDAHHREKDMSDPFFAIYETSDGAQGTVSYTIKDTWNDQGPNQELVIDELLWASGDAYAALWRYCLEVDLVRTVTGWKRPVDEPLLNMLLEPRALRFQIRDGTWLRLVDVARALEARRYSHEGSLVLEIRDEFAQWNDGTYELSGGPDGAACQQSGAAPDLSMRVEDLAAAYLGAVPFRSLAAAGRVTENKQGALKTADEMFSSAVAPWCPWIF
ncbi:MAG: GNAT family N-acetyltransferase, partial [Actinomycetota bacterium]